MKHTFAALAACFCLLAPVGASAASPSLPDYSDLWWNAGENGWGAHITLQGDVVFLVVYTYDAQRRPRFFVASDMRLESAATGGHEFRGTLYRTTGSPFAAAYDASRKSATPVGSATLRFASPASASLRYEVDGAMVEKSLTRQTWSRVKLAGTYRGGGFGATSATCTSGAGLPTFSSPGLVEVTQAGDSVTLETLFEPGFAEQGRCLYSGRLVQQGGIVGITQGTYQCEYVNGPLPVSGTFEMTDVEISDSGFNGRFVATESTCGFTGRFGGIRRGYAITTPLPEDPGAP